MSDFAIGLCGFPVLLLLIVLRIPLAAALFLTGLAGTWMISGDLRMINSQLKTFAFGTFTNYSLSIIPLFLLMSEFATRGGLSQRLFRSAELWLGHRRGGLAMASIGASAGFGAICGSSLATASTMGRVALPELQRAGYSGALSTGALAAGGTLGILIPPSVVLVIYAILAEVNIEKLFTAAFIPGIAAMAGYMLTVSIYVRLVPQAAVPLPRQPWSVRLQSLQQLTPVAVIFVLVIGGIYSGAFTPTAAAAVGVACTAVVAFRNGGLNGQALRESLLSTMNTSVMIFFIVLAAGVFNAFMSLAQVPQTLTDTLLQSSFSPWLILSIMLLFYLVLGTLMDSLAMVFLTVPMFVPIVTQLDFGLSPIEVGIWFGILVLVSTEVGLITPPVGLNLFVINAMAPSVSIAQTYRGALPFVLSDIVRIVLLVTFPSISLFLVRLWFP